MDLFDTVHACTPIDYISIFLNNTWIYLKLQDVLTQSEMAMSVVKDLFGDDPKVELVLF